MKKVVITTDSGCCPIDQENMIPAQVIMDDGIKSFRDVIEITPERIMELKNNKHVFRTSSPLLDDYEKKFTSILEQDSDVLHLSMGSGISEGSVNGASIIADELNNRYNNKVYVLDTITGASGGTLINLLANDLKKRGYTARYIKAILEGYKHQIITRHFVKDPTGFIFSGRDKSSKLSGALRLGINFSNKMKLKYLVDMTSDTGELAVRKMYRGTTVNKLKQFIDELLKDHLEEYDDDYFCLTSTPYEETSEEEIVNYIKSYDYFKNVVATSSNGVITSYGCYDMVSCSVKKKSLVKKD